MDLNQYRKRKLAARHANDPPKPYACDKCHKTFAYVEAFRSHSKQSHGCRDAGFIRLGRNAPAQPLIGHPHHVMQPQSRSVCHSGLGDGPDPASFEAPDLPDLPECCDLAGSASEQHGPTSCGQHGHHEQLCRADRACLEAAEQQGPSGSAPAPLSSSRLQSSGRAATFSQAVVLPALAVLPGRARDKLLKGISDDRFDSSEISRRWPDNKAYVDEMDELQVGACDTDFTRACHVC